MDINFYDKLLGYYKGVIETDERYEKRLQSEEKDAYRVIKALNGGGRQLRIKNLFDLACLINASKQLTISGSRNMFEEFIALPQVNNTINSVNTKNPAQIQAIQDYDFSNWEQLETPLEQQHTQIEEFRRFNTESDYSSILAKAKRIIDEKRPIIIKTQAETEDELTNKEKSIIAISKMIIRLEGFAPSSEIQFEEGKVSLNYKDADKVFGDSSRDNGLVMVPTPAEIEEKEKQEEHRRQREKQERERQRQEYEKTMAERWSMGNKKPSSQKKAEVRAKWDMGKDSKHTDNARRQQTQQKGRGISR